MQDYTESERIEKESNIAFISTKNIQAEAKEFYHTNILISLLKECTREKLLNSCAIRSLHYQICFIQVIGFSCAFISNYSLLFSNETFKVSLIFSRPFSSFSLVELIILFLAPFFLVSTVLVSIQVLNKSMITPVIRNSLITFLLFVCFGIILMSLKTNYHTTLLIAITLFIILILMAKLKNMCNKQKVVDSNLAKAIRTTSQYREHIASHFIAKAKLEIALKTAEDALENPRLYF
jgi:hypothetical protein